MFSKALSAVAATLFLVPQIANGQSAPLSDGVYTRPESAAVAPVEIPEARLLAGVRAYPPGVLPALFTVSQQPAVIQQLAEDPQKLMNPQAISPPVSAELQNAIRQLQQVPEAVALAAAYPDEIEILRQLYERAPQQTEQRLADLRARYDAARVQAGRAWQELLYEHPGALDAYRALVTQFTRDQWKQYGDFPYVEVKQTRYYYAAPPNELIMAYAEDRKPGAPLDAILQIWWNRYGPDQVDDLVFSQSDLAVGGSSVAAMSPERRAEMWQPARDRTGSGNALLPIIMQPLPDQPADAQAAFAIVENARLWSGPQNDRLTQQPPVASPSPDMPGPNAAPQHAAPEAGESVLPEEPPAYVEQGPDYEYEYEYTTEVGVQPQIVYTAPATVYYSPLVPYYYAYPAAWPVAYSCYPGLYTSWPYDWYAPGAYFSFSFGRVPHYYRCGSAYWGRGYWGCGIWRGHGHWARPHHYYGQGYHGRDGYHVGRYGRGLDRITHQFRGGERYGHGRDRISPIGRDARRGDRYGLADRIGALRSDRLGTARGDRSGIVRGDRSASAHGDRLGSVRRSATDRGERITGKDRSADGRSERLGGDRSAASRGGDRSRHTRSDRKVDRRSPEGSQILRQGSGGRSLERGQSTRNVAAPGRATQFRLRKWW